MSSVRKRLRDISPRLARYVRYLSPNILTICGVVCSILTPLVAYTTGSSLMVMVIAALALLMDALDGSVARLRGMVTRYGAFLDSVGDRISDAALVLALYFLGCNFFLVYLVTSLSLIISYTRARAEALGVGGLSEVGFMTREFRSASILLVYLVHYILGTRAADYFLIVLVAVLCATVFQRIVYTLKELRNSEG